MPTHRPQPDQQEATSRLFRQILFRGYHPPTSNTTYAPNQFFDVVLPHFSRGVVRLVAYMIRKTLGWCDQHGNPQETEILITYRDLIDGAGIGRARIREAIEEATAAHFIRCVRPGRAKGAGVSAESALFELCWNDSGPYTTNPKEFQGFFAGEGHRTYVPNDFFDEAVCNESLAVVRVVGAIIRHTIGFQTRYGFRRQQVQMSFSTLQRRTQLSRTHLNKALQTAIARNHVLRIEEGFFDPNAGHLSRATVYAIRWVDSDIHQLIGSKRLPDPEPIGSKRLPARPDPDRFQKVTGIGSKKLPEDRFQKVTDKEITLRNNTRQITQQQAAAAPAEIVALLQENGFGRRDATRIASTYPAQQIRDQINWLRRRQPKRNAVGMLRRAIEENWPVPVEVAPEATVGDSGLGTLFASHFYAGYHGNEGAPTAPPSSNDAQRAEAYARRLLELWPDESKVPEWGRSLGKIAAKAQQFSDRKIISCVAALRSHGDELYTRLQGQRKQERQRMVMEAEEQHHARFFPAYLDYLAEEEERLKREQREAYAEFEAQRIEERAQIERNPYFRGQQQVQQLRRFDSQQSRLEALHTFFGEATMDFWTWDEQRNPKRFDSTSVTV